MAPPFEIDTSPLNEESKQLAIKELRETPEIVQQGLKELRELLKKDDKMSFKDDDETLTIFLRPCKYYAQSAYELMKRISDFKVKHAKILDNLLPSDEKTAFTEHNVINVLTNRDHKGRRVLVVNAGGSWNPSKVSTDAMFRILFLMHQAAMLEPETQVRGIVVILDFDGMGMKQVTSLTPSVSMRLLSFIQDAIPLRLKEVHIVKQPGIFDLVWKIFKPLIREKLKGRIFFHGKKMETLHEHLAPSHLPEDYGGQLPKIDYSGADWYPCIESHIDHIRNYNQWGYKK